MGLWVRCREVWEGGDLVNSVEEFGASLWSMVRGIWKEGGDGFYGGGSGVWAGFGLMRGDGGVGSGCWVIGCCLGKDLGEFGGLWRSGS